MSNYSFSRLERAYLQMQPTFGTIPNTSGTATLGNANACRFTSMELANEVALLARPDKTGTRGQEGYIGGRKAGRWSINMAVAGNGTQGTAPDCDPILQAAFGQASTSCTSAAISITSSTGATPIVLTTSAHTIPTGSVEIVTIANHLTNVAANGTWLAYANSTTSLTLIGSSGTGAGTAGTAARAKVSYTFVDTIAQFALWSFRTPSTLDQRVANTCVVSEVSFTLNQDVATWSANGDCLWVLGSNSFGIADAYQAGGLTTFPAEPSAPVTNGTIVPGFTGRFVAGSAAKNSTLAGYSTAALSFPTIRNVSIRIQTQNMLVRDTFGSYYATLSEGDVRNVSISFNVYDDDGTAVNSLKQWADSVTAVDFVINLGTTPGNTWVHYLKNVYLATSVLGDGQLRFDVSFGDSRATASSLMLLDEYSLIIT
jgi:hypothetical protein